MEVGYSSVTSSCHTQLWATPRTRSLSATACNPSNIQTSMTRLLSPHFLDKKIRFRELQWFFSTWCGAEIWTHKGACALSILDNTKLNTEKLMMSPEWPLLRDTLSLHFFASPPKKCGWVFLKTMDDFTVFNRVVNKTKVKNTALF